MLGTVGAIGVILPVPPTTPFLLLIAGGYARGSRRFHHWLLNSRVFGRYVCDYCEGHGIAPGTRLTKPVMLWPVIL